MFSMVGYVWLKQKIRARGIAIGDGCALFDLSPTGFRVQQAARNTLQTCTALDLVYDYIEAEGSNFIVKGLDHFWMNILNAQAVRLRLQIVKAELKKAIVAHAALKQRGEPVRLLSIAAGSAKGVLAAVHELRSLGISVEVTLMDIDRSALARAQARAQKYGIENSIHTVLANVLKFDQKLREVSYDVIEMCGLLDYLPDNRVRDMLEKVRAFMTKKGTFLTCHIHDNPERLFMDFIVKWKMRYRSKAVFSDFLREAGFGEIDLRTEPCGIHTVAICTV